MDKIILSSISCHAILGTLPHERTLRQPLLLHAELSGDFRKAAMSDNFHDTFDYAAVESELHDLTEESSFYLLEALAEFLAGRILKDFPSIQGIRLRIDKPRAPKYAQCVSIEIERTREQSL